MKRLYDMHDGTDVFFFHFDLYEWEGVAPGYTPIKIWMQELLYVLQHTYVYVGNYHHQTGLLINIKRKTCLAKKSYSDKSRFEEFVDQGGSIPFKYQKLPSLMKCNFT